MHKLDTSYSLIILLGLALFPSISRATDCTKTTDCTAMGYTKSASDCSGKNMWSCRQCKQSDFGNGRHNVGKPLL